MCLVMMPISKPITSLSGRTNIKMNSHKRVQKKLTKEELNSRLSDRQVTLLGDYENYHAKTLFQCANSHTWMAAPANVLNGTGCPTCSGNRPLTQEIANERLKARGIRMLDPYVHQKSKARFQCKEGHIWETSSGTVLYEGGCPKCSKVLAANKKRLKPEAIQKRLEGRGIVLVSQYSHANVKANFKCGHGHIWEATPASVMSGNGCPQCSGRVPLTKEIIQSRIEKRGITILNFSGSKSRSRFGCGEGHEWETSPSNVVNGSGCPRCAKQAQENRYRKIIVDGREFKSIQSAARHYGRSSNNIAYRLSKGWTPEQAVGLHPRPSFAGNTAGIPVRVQGLEFSNLKQAAKHFGRSYTYLVGRLKDGKTIEQSLGLIKRTDSLQSEYPELAKQWHPEKNLPLTAASVTPHSGIKAWWYCLNGHDWQASINSRARGGHGCPFCAGQRPTKERNFAVKFPESVKQWDFEKNQNLRPEECSTRSKNDVWWKCERGHSWHATIQNRTRKWKSSCPYCMNLRLGFDNSLAQVRPDIAKEWHPTKNAPLTPNDVVAGGSKPRWWICKHGHEWQAPINRRVINGSGCSKCSLQTSRIEIAVYSELTALFEDVVWREKIAGYECDIYLKTHDIGIEIDGVYWHSRKPELEVKKSKLFESEGLLLFRLREKGLQALSERDVAFKFSDKEFHVISRLVNSILKHANLTEAQRVRLQNYISGPGLINEKFYHKLISNLPAPPPDQSLAAKNPAIAAQWAFDLNAPLLPEHFRCGANKYVFWRCSDGHTWKASINNRALQGTKCPGCPGKSTVTVNEDNNFASKYPHLVREWHQEKNGDVLPGKIRHKSNQIFWWLCSKGHEWKSSPSSRASGHGCPYCYGRFASKENNLAYKYPELLKEWDYEKNIGLNPSEFTPHVNKKVWWNCKNGHNYQATISNRTRNKSGCPKCAQHANRKHSIDDFEKLANNRGGKCLSTEFTSSRDKMKFSCKEGHVWETRADSVLYTDKWCPECARKTRRTISIS